MKNIHPTFVFVFFISLVFCSEDEKYTFAWYNANWDSATAEVNIGEKLIYRNSYETSFTIPGIGFIKYSDKYVETIEFLGVEGDFWKYKATLTDMESDNHVGGIAILDQYREAMEDNSCYLYVKSSGPDDMVNRIEPVKEEHYYLQEAFESAHMNLSPIHFRYPFGGDERMLKEGEVVSYTYDSIRVYINMGSPPSTVSATGTYKLKKVKEKWGGRKIAYVKMDELVTFDVFISVNFLGEKRLITGHATGSTEVDYKWDIDFGEILKAYAVTNIVGDFEMDGETFHMKVFQRNISTKVK